MQVLIWTSPHKLQRGRMSLMEWMRTGIKQILHKYIAGSHMPLHHKIHMASGVDAQRTSGNIKRIIFSGGSLCENRHKGINIIKAEQVLIWGS